MGGWSDHKGQVVVLNIDNIDTDQLIPARFMSVPRNEGYGGYLLHDMRRDVGGALRDDFPLNQNPTASILIAGCNFGTGSSREAAVYALVDAGLRAVIAPSFGDIFASNAVNNGLLPACLPASDIALLRAAMQSGVKNVSISLTSKKIICGAQTVTFGLDEAWRVKLDNGWDDIDLTLRHRGDIETYRSMRRDAVPWAWPHRSD